MGAGATVLDPVVSGSESPASDRLAAAVRAREHADELVAVEVVAMIDSGASWAQVALALGVSKQAAHERYRKTIHARGARSNQDGRTTA